jgi:hypothetical protein
MFQMFQNIVACSDRGPSRISVFAPFSRSLSAKDPPPNPVTGSLFEWRRVRVHLLPLHFCVLVADCHWSGEERCTQMTVLWHVPPCSLTEGYEYRGACCLHLLPWWWLKASSEPWYLYNGLYDVTHQETIIFCGLSDLTQCKQLTSSMQLKGLSYEGLCL